MSILETVKSKLKANTYVMSCYLTQGDLYAEMKEHLGLLVEELEKHTPSEGVQTYIAFDQSIGSGKKRLVSARSMEEARKMLYADGFRIRTLQPLKQYSKRYKK